MQAQDHQSQQNRQPARLVEKNSEEVFLFSQDFMFYVTFKFQTNKLIEIIHFLSAERIDSEQDLFLST